MKLRPVESEILRAVRRGDIGWGDLSSDHRDYRVPVKTVGRPYVEEAKDDSIAKIKSPVVDQTTANTVADDTIGETVSSAKQEQSQQPKQKKSTVDATGSPVQKTASPVAARPTPLKPYSIFNFASDSFKDFRIGLIKAQGDDAAGRNSFNVAPNMVAADDIYKGLNSKDPDIVRVAQFIRDKQSEQFYDRPKTEFSDKQVMSASEIAEYNRLKNEDSRAMEMSGFGAGFGYTGDSSSAEKYKRSLEAKYARSGKQLVTPMEMHSMTRDALAAKNMVDSNYAGTQIGQAMKAPLRYMANPIKLVGDIASIIDENQTLFQSTKGDIASDSENQARDARESYISRKYYGSNDDLKIAGRRMLSNFTGEAAGSAAQALAIGSMLAGSAGSLAVQGQGSGNLISRAIQSKLPQFESMMRGAGVGATYLGAGHAAYLASDAVRKTGWRDIDDSEIPDDMKDAFSKYGKALVHASRSEYKEMPDPNDIADGRLPESSRWYYEIKHRLNKDYNDNIKEYNESQAKLSDYPKTSQYFEDQKASGNLMFNWQESFGASSKEWVAQTAGMLSSIVLHKAANTLSARGILKGNAPYISASAMSGFVNAGAAFVSREGEFYSQFADTWNSKLEAKLNELGKSDYFKNLNNPELERQIKAGVVDPDDRDITEAIYYANEQADELARQQMSLIYTDMGSIVSASLPFNMKAISNSQRASNTLFGNISKAADEVTDWATRNTLGKINTQKSIGKIGYFIGKMGAKGAASTALEAITETFGEEVPQFISSDLYSKNELNSKRSHLASLVDIYGAAITGTKAAFGLSGDERYDSNPELLKTVKHSLVLSSIMGATHGIPANIATASDVANEITARNFIKSTVVPGMRAVAREGKTSEYMNLRSRGKQDAVLQYMDELKSNMPEGITSDDIDREISLAKRTFEVMDSKPVRDYAKNAGGVNSDNHKLLVSLIIDHEDMEAESMRYHEEMYDSALESIDRNMPSSNLGKHLKRVLSEKSIDGVDTESSAKRIYALMAQLQGLKYLDWSVNERGSEMSKKRDRAILDSAKQQSRVYLNSLIDELSLVDLITKEQSSELSSMDNISKVEEYLESNGILVGADQETVDRLGLSAAAYAGSEYERISSEMLSGYSTEYTNDENGVLSVSRKRIDNYDAQVDMYLDAYRSARKEEEDLEKSLSAASKAKNRAIRKYTGRGVIPFQTYINEIPPSAENEESEQQSIDSSILAMQQRTGRSGRVEISLSDETDLTLDKIDNGEFQPNTFLQSAMDELYKERNRLIGSKKSKSRLHTRSQIDQMIDFIEDYLDIIGEKMSENEMSSLGREWSGNRRMNRGFRFGRNATESTPEVISPVEAPIEPVEPISPVETTDVPAAEESGLESKEMPLQAKPVVRNVELMSDKGATVVEPDITKSHEESSRESSSANDDIQEPVINESIEVSDSDGSSVSEDDIEFGNKSEDIDDIRDAANEAIESTGNKHTPEGEPSQDEIDARLENEDSSAYYELDTIYPNMISPENPDIRYDKLSHTLIWQTKHGNADRVREWLVKPNALNNARIKFVVKEIPEKDWAERRKGPDKAYVKFDRTKPETYDAAIVEVEIISESGVVYKFMLSIPNAAEYSFKKIGDTLVKVYSDSEIEALREFRNSVINAIINKDEQQIKISKSGEKIVLGLDVTLQRGKAKISLNRDADGRAIQRPVGNILGMIDGFDPKNPDWTKVGVETLKLAYGRGGRGRNVMVGPDRTYGFTTEQASGAIFVIKQNPVTGFEERIKINKLRMKDDKSVARLIYSLAVRMKASPNAYITFDNSGKIRPLEAGEIQSFSISANKLLTTIVNFGGHTYVDPGERNEFKHLIKKQFYITNDGSKLVYGDSYIDISNPNEISNEKANEIIRYIEDNFHWNIDKNNLWNELGGDAIVGNLFPEMSGYFENNDGELRFTDSMVFTKEDMNLTWTAWLAKNGKLVSDVNDGLFDPTFLYMSEPTIIDSKTMAPHIPTSTQPSVSPIEIDDIPSDLNDDTSMFDDMDLALGIDPSVFRISSGTEAMTEDDLNEESAWLQNKLGIHRKIDNDQYDDSVSSLDIIDEAIDAGDGNIAMGATKWNSIVLWKGAERGTLYHEAFHYVSLIAMPRNRRMKVYNTVRNSEDGKYKNFTDKEIEEFLAEGFREYMLTGSTPFQQSKDKSLKSRVKNLFKRIKSLVMSFVGMNDGDVYRLYKDINSGKFKSARKYGYSSEYSRHNRNEFVLKYGLSEDGGAAFRVADLGMKSITDYKLLNNLVDGLSFMVKHYGNVNTISDIGNINKGIEIVVSKIKKDLPKMDEVKRAIYQDVIDNFESIFLPRINKVFSGMGVEYIDESETAREGENTISEEIMYHAKGSHEFSKRDNLTSEIKFFLRTIPNTVIKDGRPTFVRNDVTGMYGFVPFEQAWNKCVADLSDSRTVESMLNKINALAKVESSGFYAVLASKIKASDENTKTKLWISLRNHINQYVNIQYTSNIDENSKAFTIIDASLDNPSRKFPIQWGETLAAINTIYKTTDKGVEFDESEAKSILKAYDELVSLAYGHISGVNKIPDDSLHYIKNEYVNLFRKMGITIDSETIDHITNEYYHDMDRVSALAKLIENSKPGMPSMLFSVLLPQIIKGNGSIKYKNGSVIPFKNMYKGEKYIKNIGLAYASTHRSSTEQTVRSASGDTYHSVSERNYVINSYERLFTDKQHRRYLISSPYVKGASRDSSIPGSMFVNQINNNTAYNPAIKTFLKIYNADKSGSDLGYKDVSLLEDYVMKMAATLSGYATIPTMADKNIYYFISGFKMPNLLSGSTRASYSETVDQSTGKPIVSSIHLRLPNEYLRQLNNYFRAEFEAIKEAVDHYAATENNKEGRIAGYHYKGKNPYTGESWAANHGNGMRFRNFDLIQINLEENGRRINQLLNLNDKIDEFVNNAIARGDSDIDGMRDFISFMNTNYFGMDESIALQTMSNTFNVALESELQWMSDQGIIKYERNDDGSIVLENSFIDNAMFNEQLKGLGAANGNVDVNNRHALISIVGNHVLNTIISNTEFDKVVAGDPAFYGTQINKLKRHSMLLSTGSPLRIDFPVGHEFGPVDPSVPNQLDDRQIRHKAGKFLSGEISDNIMYSKELDKIYSNIAAAQFTETTGIEMTMEELAPMFVQGKMSDAISKVIGDNAAYKRAYKTAVAVADNYTSGYSKVDETDGGAFISAYMYRSILIREGKWKPEWDEAFEMMEGEDTSWMSDPAKYMKVADLTFGPLKMIYVGNQPAKGVNSVKTHKMALFAVTRPMATGDMKVIYDLMNNPKPGAGHFDFISVAQVNKTVSQNPKPFYTDDSNTKITPDLELDAYEDSFENLLHQLPTDPHGVEDMNIATQVQKVSMSNIDRSKIYRNLSVGGKDGATGSELLNEWMNAIVSLSNRGRKKFESMLGIKINPVTGAYSINSKKLFDELSNKAENSNMPEDVVDMFRSFNESNQNDIPLQAFMDGGWIENAFISLLTKDTIDLKMPGGMYVQRSPFGIPSTYDNGVEIKINNGERLRFINEDGSMDAIISINFFSDLFPNNLKNGSFVQKRQWLIDNNIIGKNSITSAIGYRIPTQGLSSISGLKFVDVVDDTQGDTIMLPSEFTRLTGADFDIDKLFLSRYNFRANNGSVDVIRMNDDIPDKWERNSERAIQNRLLEAMLASITELSSIHETRMPLDNTTDAMKELLSEIEGLVQSTSKVGPFNFILPSFMTEKKVEYTVSKSGIGPYAQGNSNHPLTQIAGLEFIENNLLSMLGMQRLDLVKGRDGVRILDWLSALINAHVDVVKDPYIIRLGINKNTYKISSLLLRTGVGKNTFYYLSQPSLKEFYKIMDRFSGGYGSDSSEFSSADFQLSTLISKYRNLAESLVQTEEQKDMLLAFDELTEGGYKLLENCSDVFDTDFLRNALSSTTYDFDYYYDQLKVLEIFKALQAFSNGLANLVKYSQIDTKKGGNTFAEQIEFAEQVNKMIKLERSGSGVFNGVERYYNVTGLLRRLENSSILLQSLSSGMFFRTTPAVRYAAKRVYSAAKCRVGGDFKTLSKINKYIDSYIKSEFFNNFSEKNNIDVKGLFFGENTIAKRLFRIKQGMTPEGRFSKFAGNEFLENLTYSIEPSNQFTVPDHVYPMISATSDQSAVNRTKQYLSDLINLDVVTDDDAVVKEFVRDFIAYQFYSTGDNMSQNTVKIAEDDRYKIGYEDNGKKVTLYSFIADKMSEILNIAGDEFLSDSDMENIFLNRWHDNDLVRTVNIVYGYEYGSDPTGMTSGKQALRSPAIYSTDLDRPVKMFGNSYPLMFVDNSAKSFLYSDGHKVFSPFVKMKFNKLDDKGVSTGKVFYIVYKLIGVTNPVEKYKQKPIYSAVNKFGSKISGYGLIEHGKRTSDIYDNNLPLADYHMNKNVTPENLMSRKDNINAYNFGVIMTDYIRVNPFNVNIPDYSIDTSNLDEAASISDSIANIQIDQMIELADYSMSEFRNSVEEKYAAYGSAWRDNLYSSVAKGLISRIDDLIGNINATDDILEMIKSDAIDYLSKYIKEEPIEQAEEVPFGGTSGVVAGSPSDESINIYSGTHDNPELSNFATRPFNYNGFRYNSVEQAFQHQKLRTSAPHSGASNYLNDEIDSKIMSSKTGAEAKLLGRQIKDLNRAAWDRISSGVMRELILESFKQNPDALQRLLATGNAILTHKYNGVEQDGGRFSRLLMDVRSQLRSELPSHPTVKIISGGQTGVDRIGLEIGRELGIDTGGTATPGFIVEGNVSDESLKEFGLEEISSELQAGNNGKRFYLPRTEQNVINSDGTVYFSTDDDSAGKIATERFARRHGKPFLLNPTSEELRAWLIDNNINTLNVAGNRGSKLSSEKSDEIASTLRNALATEVQSSPVESVSMPAQNANTELIEEYGTTYRFVFEDGVITSAQYRQGRREWANIKNAMKTYERLKSSSNARPVEGGLDNGVASASSIQTSRTPDMRLFGKNIFLSDIGIPFQPNEDQIDALEKIAKWIDTDGFSTFALKGYAGTGKTAITKILTAALDASKIKYALMSPTHKAKRVLSNATGKTVYTIHKFLGKRIEDQEVGKNSKFTGLLDLNMRMNMVLIVDESSMIDDNMVDDLLRAASDYKSKILFIGDDAQIDPVSNRNMPSKSLSQGNSVTLDKVMRVSNGNPIIDVATAMRKAQSPEFIGKFSDLFLSQFSRFNSFNDSGGIIFLGPSSANAALEYAIDKWFTSDEAKGNPNYVRYIAYRNSVVDSVNVRVRERLGYEGVVEVGEIITGNTKYSDENKDIQNDDEYVVTSIDSEPYMIRSYSVPGVDLPVIDVTIDTYSGDSKGGTIKLLVDYSPEMIRKIQIAISSRLDDIYSERDLSVRRDLNNMMFASLNSDFDTIINIPNPAKSGGESDNDHYKRKTFGYSYAITAHKSQGSEFENVIINDSDIRRYGGMEDGIGYKKLLYTSITRAKHKAIVITDGGRYDMQNKTPVVGESMDAAAFSEFTKETALDKIKELGNQSDNC